ncbi:hypothetical protein PSSHI_13470 [Photobacterium sp. R1]
MPFDLRVSMTLSEQSCSFNRNVVQDIRLLGDKLTARIELDRARKSYSKNTDKER